MIRRNARIDSLLIAVPITCGLWILVVPLMYVVTLDETIVTHWVEANSDGRPLIITGYALVHILIIPIALYLGLRWLHRWIHSSRLFGGVIGVVFGLWSSTIMLTLPYIGVYPNLVGALMGSILSRGANTGASYYLPIIATNLVLFPFLGWIIIGRRKPIGEH